MSNLDPDQAAWLSHERSLSNEARAKRIMALRGLGAEKLVRPRDLTGVTKKHTV
jgi:hypothetical protein